MAIAEVRTLEAVHFDGSVTTSLLAKHGCTFSEKQQGVEVSKKGAKVLVPWGNVRALYYEPEARKEAKP